MRYRMNFVLLVALAMLALLVCTTAQANVISVVTFTDDATSGISGSKTYTHLIDGGSGGPATVNGVLFDAVNPQPAVPDLNLPALGYRHQSPWGQGIAPAIWDATTPISNTEGVFMLLNDTLYSQSNTSPGLQTITLSGLAQGTTYDARLYYRPWDSNADRVIEVAFDEDGAGPEGDSTTVAEGGGTTASYLSYVYTADASGELVITLLPTINADVNWHMYGLTNEVVVPEPGTLALLATSLIGLLCYAWRKRK